MWNVFSWIPFGFSLTLMLKKSNVTATDKASSVYVGMTSVCVCSLVSYQSQAVCWAPPSSVLWDHLFFMATTSLWSTLLLWWVKLTYSTVIFEIMEISKHLFRLKSKLHLEYRNSVHNVNYYKTCKNSAKLPTPQLQISSSHSAAEYYTLLSRNDCDSTCKRTQKGVCDRITSHSSVWSTPVFTVIPSLAFCLGN